MKLDDIQETLQAAGKGSIVYASTGLLLILCSIYLADTGNAVLPFTMAISGGMLFGHSMGIDSVRADFAHKIVEMRRENGKYLP